MNDQKTPPDDSRTLRVRASSVGRARLRSQASEGPGPGEAGRIDRTTDRLDPHETPRPRDEGPSPTDDRLEFLQPGDVLFGFRLRHPLGQGAFARVFVAEQADLADRPVVLKVSAIEGAEPQTLSRLQHTNIVPIYSVHEDPASGLRGVCMPYFAGANLSSILESLWSMTQRPTCGAELVGALKGVSSPAPECWSAARRDRDRVEDGGPTPERSAEHQTPLCLLGGLGYLKAVAWVVAQLAEGLDHAHQRNIIHRDIKPSNILLSSEGQPLLLDFNVSIDATVDAAPALLGGTIAYAAPEHLRALTLCTLEQFQAVDRRSDLYSLGLVLVEALTGRRPFAQDGSDSVLPAQLDAMVAERSKGAPSLRKIRPDTPWSLESILARCLDPDPAQRYQQAGQLAEDLHRFVEDRPLKHAPELSRVERVRKFFRRNPRLLTFGSIAAVALALLLAGGWALLGTRTRLVEVRSRLSESQARERKRAHDAGVMQCQCLVNTILGDEDHLRRGIAVCERTLALYEPGDGRSPQEHPDWVRLAPAERHSLAEDRRELLLLLAGARVRLASGGPREARQALMLLDRAESLRGLGPSKALWLDRATYLDRLGKHEAATAARSRADQIEPATARDYYLLAISHARTRTARGYRRAVTELGEALRLNPRHYWSVMQRGICHMELGAPILAVRDFGISSGLWPEHPWSYFNRGYVLERDGLKAEAIDDYSAALRRDPRFVAALTNRGLVRLELGRYEPALTDFDAALSLSRGTAAIHAGRAIALERLGRHAEADSAFRETFGQAGPGPGPERTRLIWTYGFAVADRLPEGARAAFDEVLRHDPRHPQALYGRAMLAMKEGQLPPALAFFDRALETTPTFTQARRSRAVVLARLRDIERASRDVDWCLEHDPESGDSAYAAACVAALAARANPDPRTIDRALDHLERALDLGVRQAADDDPDLVAIRHHPRFQTILAGAAGPGARR